MVRELGEGGGTNVVVAGGADPELAAVGGGDRVDERETEAGAWAAARGFVAPEAFKNEARRGGGTTQNVLFCVDWPGGRANQRFT